MKSVAVLACAGLFALPAAAQQADDPLAPLDPGPAQQTVSPPVTTPTPAPAPPPRVIPRDWRGIFSAIDAGDWEGARLGLAAMPAGPLKPYAMAKLFAARGSPVAALADITALLTEAPELPQAEQLSRLAVTRGAVQAPAVYLPRPTIPLGQAPRRGRTRPVQGELAADALRVALEPFVKVDDGPGAEALYLQAVPTLSYEARAEAAHRVAWIYFVAGRDADARRIATEGRVGATGDWAAQTAWIGGLASWRLNDCAAAYDGFREAARLGRDAEFNAAANYWTARAAQACRRPREVTPLLRAAARSPESFYGLLAREALGMDKRLPKPAAARDVDHVESLPNVKRAAALVDLGRRAEAEELLRHQAKIGNPAHHRALIRIADKMNLPGAQFWLAHFGPAGASSDPADRYPRPNWTPYNGWRVDPALAYAHVIQESNFRAEAVSPAGAVGLMQVRPGTAGDTSRARGTGATVSTAALQDPLANIDYGQAFIELIRRNGATQGQLPKVIAAYNAGPVPVARWAYYDRGDPLLWIESIPYWETRFYVPAVLRNMWVIQGLEGEATPTLDALTQHKWPDFPNRR